MAGNVRLFTAATYIRHNANYILYAQMPACPLLGVSSLTLDCNRVFAIKGYYIGLYIIAMAPATNDASSILYYHCDVCWFARSIRRTCVAWLAFRQHVETNANATVFQVPFAYPCQNILCIIRVI